MGPPSMPAWKHLEEAVSTSSSIETQPTSTSGYATKDFVLISFDRGAEAGSERKIEGKVDTEDEVDDEIEEELSKIRTQTVPSVRVRDEHDLNACASRIAAAAGEGPFDHLTDGLGDRCAARTASSAADAPVVPKPMKTASGPLWPSTRVLPPKYLLANELGAELVGGLLSDFSRSWVRVFCKIPAPRTAMLPLEKTIDAYFLMAPTSTGWCSAKSRSTPRLLRKARTCASLSRA